MLDGVVETELALSRELEHDRRYEGLCDAGGAEPIPRPQRDAWLSLRDTGGCAADARPRSYFRKRARSALSDEELDNALEDRRRTGGRPRRQHVR